MASTQHPDGGTSARLVSVRPSVASRQSVSSAAATTSTTSPSRALAGRAQLAQPPRGEPSRAEPGRSRPQVSGTICHAGIEPAGRRPAARAGPAVSSHRRGYTAGATRYQQPRRPVRRRPARPGPTRRSQLLLKPDGRLDGGAGLPDVSQRHLLITRPPTPPHPDSSASKLASSSARCLSVRQLLTPCTPTLDPAR